MPIGDAVCSHCGSLLFPHLQKGRVSSDAEKSLAERGITVETNDEGEITLVRLDGPWFGDSSLVLLGKLTSVPRIELSGTTFTSEGMETLRRLLPDAIIVEI
ncbi:MAG: hypothetical protein ACK5YR_09355 [Pirellula sp.]|jgi:hypothetical protein